MIDCLYRALFIYFPFKFILDQSYIIITIITNTIKTYEYNYGCYYSQFVL